MYVCMYVCMYIYIYICFCHIYIYMAVRRKTPNLPNKIVDFRGFDSSIMFIERGGIPRPIGDFPESSSQAMLVGTTLVGRLGV